jgi:hypothetical protein
METQNKTIKKDYEISFKFIVENCKIISDLIKLNDEVLRE